MIKDELNDSSIADNDAATLDSKARYMRDKRKEAYNPFKGRIIDQARSLCRPN